MHQALLQALGISCRRKQTKMPAQVEPVSTSWPMPPAASWFLWLLASAASWLLISAPDSYQLLCFVRFTLSLSRENLTSSVSEHLVAQKFCPRPLHR